MAPYETTLSRRTLAKGAAWAAPVVAASTIAPAYAVSPPKCPNTGAPQHITAAKFHWGKLGQSNQEQQLLLFSRMRITDVSVGSIASLKVDYVIQQRTSGTQPGAPVATASTSNWTNGTVYTGGQTGMTSKGGTGVLTQTQENVSIKYATNNAGTTVTEGYTPDTGTPYTSYVLSYEVTNLGEEYYTKGSSDCDAVFDTGSGPYLNTGDSRYTNTSDDINTLLRTTGTPIEIKWTGQTGPSSLSVDSLHITTHWTYTLTDGRKMSVRYPNNESGSFYDVIETTLPTQPAANTAQFSNTGW